jgi:exo-rhamnogalacturonan lyase-like protein
LLAFDAMVDRIGISSSGLKRYPFNRQEVSMRQFFVMFLVFVLAGCGVVQGQASLVQLTVQEPANVARAADPVTTGVPFAQGALPAGTALALADAAGKAVPVQTRVLAKWPDGSIKWVLVDFQTAALAAGGEVTYGLVKGAPATLAQPIKVSETKNAIIVDTGAMQISLSLEQFELFKSVKIGGAEVLAGETAGALHITDLAGKVRTSMSGELKDYKLKVVESGPIRTVVRATGEMQANDKLRLGFTCWYNFYAGQKFVRVFFTTRNLAGSSHTATDQSSVRDIAYQASVVQRNPKNLAVEAVDLVLKTKLTAKSYVLGGDKPITGALAGKSVKLYQDSSSGWTWQVAEKAIRDPRIIENQKFMKSISKPNLPYFEYSKNIYSGLLDKKRYTGCTFRGYKTYADGKESGRGERAAGWAQLGETTVGVRYFWQKYPKAFELGADGTIRIALWPKDWSSQHVFEGRTHKTHELLFAFGDSKPAETFKRFDRRLLATAPNTYYCASGAFNGYLMPENRKEYPRFEDMALTAVKCGVNKNINPSWDSSLEIEREKYDQYGVWHFGDTSKRGMRGFGQYLELDIPYCLAVHFVRTLNRSFFDELEIHERQRQDVPAHGGGYGHQKGESSHYYTTGALFYYYLTGLEHIKQSIKVSHDSFARVGPWHARSFGMTMWSNLDMYRAYDDADPTVDQPWHFPHPAWKKADYMAKIQGDLKWFLGRRAQDPATGFRGYGKYNFQEFMLGIMMDAIGRYCTEFPNDQIWRDRLVALANATMRDLPDFKYQNTWLKMANPNGYTYAYIFTGRDKYLDFAAKIMDKTIKSKDPNLPRFRSGTGAGKSWSEFGHRLTQTHMWARWYRNQNGTPKAPAAITDLKAVVKDGKLVLTWTASAGASKYIVKVAPKPIKDDLASKAEGKDAANWWTTPVAASVATPTATVNAKKGTVYVAVRAMKQAGPITATSGVSNVVKVEVK